MKRLFSPRKWREDPAFIFGFLLLISVVGLVGLAGFDVLNWLINRSVPEKSTVRAFQAFSGETNMNRGIGYTVHNRSMSTLNGYPGGTSLGDGWEIRWRGPYNQGPTPIEAVRATIEHLQHLQNTSDMASEANAKLMFNLMTAVEEYDGKKPSIGKPLDHLIPSEDHLTDNE